MRSLLTLICTSLLLSCSATSLTPNTNASPAASPQTQAALQSGYTYVPVDPFSVQIIPGENCVADAPYYPELLASLPDNSVRVSLEQFDGSGSLGIGPLGASVEGGTYKVTLDYINADTTNIDMYFRRSVVVGDDEYYHPMHSPSPAGSHPDDDSFEVRSIYDLSEDEARDQNFERHSIPVYVGVGLRIISNVVVSGANVDVSGLGAIAASAQTSSLSGNLVVQTIGVNGKSVAAALPIQSELNPTTVQNAIVAIGSVKTLLYEDDTVTAPRVVGLYLPFMGDKRLVNGIISVLVTNPVDWMRSCLTEEA